MQTFADKTHEKILESIHDFFKHGINSEVILIFTIQNHKITDTEFHVVDCGGCFFEENGYHVNGLKSYSQKDGDTDKHGYIIFETYRILGAINRINSDLDNIKADLDNKIK